MRFTRMPEKYAASWFEPIAKIARPSGVACRTTAKPTAKTAKNAIDHGICVCGIGTTPMFVRYAGKPPSELFGSTICAMPR